MNEFPRAPAAESPSSVYNITIIWCVDKINRRPMIDSNPNTPHLPHFKHHLKKFLQIKYQFLLCIPPQIHIFNLLF